MGTNIKIHLLNFFFLFLISFHSQADETLIAPEGLRLTSLQVKFKTLGK